MAATSDTIQISDDNDLTFLHDHGKQVMTSSGAVSSKKRELEGDFERKDEWSNDDSDDVVYQTWKKRKQDEVAKASKGEAVARKKRKTGKGQFNDDSSSSEILPEKLLPEYLKERRKAFNHDGERLHVAGLRLPPSYEDISFSDDEILDSLERRPQFPQRIGIKPSQDYKDIILEHSAGVIPAPIAQYLRDYQIEGVRFLHHLFVYQNGGVLGDDMGLGKTVQVAAFLTAAFGKTGDQRDAKRMRKTRRSSDGNWYPRALIICPGSLTSNWKNELATWGWWATDLYHGAGKEEVLNAARAGRFEVMITTYTTYKGNREEINRIQWDVVVADECHCMKDPNTGITQAMNEINALCRIGLTGTAIQNKYEELWTILNWTNPGKFGTMGEWKDQICKPLTIGQSHDATEQQLKKGRETAVKLIKNLLPRFFLRRTKSLIAHQLPKKRDRVVFCPLSDVQREAYENFVESPLVNLVRSAYVECACGSGRKRGWCCAKTTPDGESWRSLLFPLMMSLQKLSSHLTLLIPRSADVREKQNKELRYLQAAMPERWKQLYNSRESPLHLANPEFCGKWAILKKLLRFWLGNGDKVLVFSHSVRLLKILQYLFNNTSYSVSYLDGSLSYEDRQNAVDNFNSDPNQFVFLISTKAGGVGLNITSANKVVIMDPHWNPSYDLQAQDRAYRIGQIRDVDVYRLISAGTIEEITYARQIYKQQQANIGYTASKERRYFKGVQQDKDRKGEIFGIQNLFSFNGNHVVLRDIVNKTNIAEAKAGVNLMEIDMGQAAEDARVAQVVKREEGTEDDGGLAQLAAFVTEEENYDADLEMDTKPKTDPIHGILASVGVEYTHENSEVVGTSRVEQQLSRRAELRSSQDLGPTNRALFFDSQQDRADGDDRNTISFEYNPPEEVMQRQFCTMARMLGFPSATDFALVVEGMTQEQRRNTLDQFYQRRIEHLRKESENSFLHDDFESEIKNEAKKEVKEEDKINSVKAEDEKPLLVPKTEAKDEVKDASSRDAVKVKREGSPLIIDKKQSASIWLSDDDETDEL